MNSNMTGFRWFSKNLCILVFWAKVASALEGLRQVTQCFRFFLFPKNVGNRIYGELIGKHLAYSVWYFVIHLRNLDNKSKKKK